LKKGDSLEALAKRYGVTVDDLARLNGLKPPYRLTAGDDLKVPGQASAPAKGSAKAKAPTDERTASATPPAKSAPAAGGETATVGPGDSLARIAKAHGVKVEDLARINGIKPPYRLKPGQTLALQEQGGEAPAKAHTEAAQARSPAPAPAAEAVSTSTITVRRRDTIQSLARQAKVSVQALAELNHLKRPYRLKPGQSIRLPDEPGALADREPDAQGAPRPTASVKARRHDTLASIARRTGVKVETLAALNRLKRPYRLHPGQVIKIAGGAEDAAGAPPREGRSLAQGPTTVTARRHDSLGAIAGRTGFSAEEIADFNHLKRPYRVRRGQVLQLPTRAALTSYRVQAGDTLYSIARRFGADAKALAELNRIDVSEPIKVGQMIALPGGAQDRIAPRPSPAYRPEPQIARAQPGAAAGEPSQPVPYGALPPNPGAAPAPYAEATPAFPPYRPPGAPDASSPEALPHGGATDADAAAAGHGVFLWPVRGDVVSAFGPKTGGQRNDGIDIAGTAGAPVEAAAAGEVVYAGNSVPGFGNLVLIRHDGGWVTAYAHLAGIDVKMRQTVSQGQQIGEIGQTGGVDRPQLHFEVRYAASVRDKPRPVDPALVLPQ
jgi:murein DD-endopeptidase MepM/ murein hydrolase activator NlpD